VTNKIEYALEGVTGIKEMHSVSIEGVSNVLLEIDPDAEDKEKVKDRVRYRRGPHRQAGIP